MPARVFRSLKARIAMPCLSGNALHGPHSRDKQIRCEPAAV
jgi:hypothetical protein